MGTWHGRARVYTHFLSELHLLPTDVSCVFLYVLQRSLLCECLLFAYLSFMSALFKLLARQSISRF